MTLNIGLFLSLGFKAGRPHSTPTFPSGCFNIDWLTCSAMYIEQMDENEFARTTYVLGRPFKHGSYSLKKAGPGTSCDGGTMGETTGQWGCARWWTKMDGHYLPSTTWSCLSRNSAGEVMWYCKQKSVGKQNIQTMLMNCQRVLAKSWPRNQALHCLFLKFTPISITRSTSGPCRRNEWSKDMWNHGVSWCEATFADFNCSGNHTCWRKATGRHRQRGGDKLWLLMTSIFLDLLKSKTKLHRAFWCNVRSIIFSLWFQTSLDTETFLLSFLTWSLPIHMHMGCGVTRVDVQSTKWRLDDPIPNIEAIVQVFEPCHGESLRWHWGRRKALRSKWNNNSRTKKEAPFWDKITTVRELHHIPGHPVAEQPTINSCHLDGLFGIGCPSKRLALHFKPVCTETTSLAVNQHELWAIGHVIPVGSCAEVNSKTSQRLIPFGRLLCLRPRVLAAVPLACCAAKGHQTWRLASIFLGAGWGLCPAHGNSITSSFHDLPGWT